MTTPRLTSTRSLLSAVCGFSRRRSTTAALIDASVAGGTFPPGVLSYHS